MQSKTQHQLAFSPLSRHPPSGHRTMARHLGCFVFLCVWLCVITGTMGQDDADDLAEPKSDRLYRTAHLACDKIRDDTARAIDEDLTKSAANGVTVFNGEFPSWFVSCAGSRGIPDEVSEILCGLEYHYLIEYDLDVRVPREYEGTKGPIKGVAIPFKASTRSRLNDTPCSYLVKNKPKGKAPVHVAQPEPTPIVAPVPPQAESKPKTKRT